MMNIHVLEWLLARERIKEWKATNGEIKTIDGNAGPIIIRRPRGCEDWVIEVGREWLLSAMLDKAQAGRNLVAENFAKMKEDGR